MAPTPRAERLAVAVQSALGTLEEALNEPDRFEPGDSRKTFRIHMSDIGEGRFLPALMSRLGELAPGVRVETLPLPATPTSRPRSTAAASTSPSASCPRCATPSALRC